MRGVVSFVVVTLFFAAIYGVYSGSVYLVFVIGNAISPSLPASPYYAYPAGLLCIVLTVWFAIWVVTIGGNTTYRRRLLNRVRGLA